MAFRFVTVLEDETLALDEAAVPNSKKVTKFSLSVSVLVGRKLFFSELVLI